MTSPQRFERDLSGLLTDLYVGALPDYRDDLLRSTAATRQRPAWSFPTRWLPMDLTMRRVPAVPVAWRALAVALLILALLAAAIYVGSQRKVPPPFGLAGNGSIIATVDGDLVVRDTADGTSRLLVGGPEDDRDPGYSPDGTLVAFIRIVDSKTYLMVADLDGSHVRRVLDTPLDEDAWVQWAPDSRHLGVVSLIDGRDRFALVSTDGAPIQIASMGDLAPIDFQFRPPDGREVAVRVLDHGIVDIVLMNNDGSNLRSLNLKHVSNGGFNWQMDLHGISWSPTGDRMAYNVVGRDTPQGNDHLRVHVRTIATGDDVELPAPKITDIQQAWASWPPDGTQVLFQRFTWEKGWLGLVPAVGSSVGRDLGTPFAYKSDTEMDQAWSPDGKTILLRFDRDHFVSIDVATGAETPFAWPIDRIPDWQRVSLR
jgi:Tol biopolymer transport system component